MTERNVMYENLPFHFKSLVDNWKHAHVLQKDVAKFSGGAINGYTLANNCSKGYGPRKFRIGRHAAYDTVELANWLWKRSQKNANHGMRKQVEKR